MLHGRSLRAQLSIVYAGALLLGLAIFAAVSLVTLDRTARATLDQRLLSDANAVAAITKVKHHRIKLDADDRAQFAQIIGVTADGAIFARDGTVIGASQATIPEPVRSFAQSVTQGTRIDTVASGASSLRIVSTPVVSDGIVRGFVAIWRSLDDIAGLDRRAALLFALSIPVIAAFAIFFGGLVADRGLRPLRKIATLASDIEAQDLSQRLHVPGADGELAQLCATIDRMLDRLEAAFARERRFTSEASHEIRGPLTVMRAEAELALRRERDPADYQRALAIIVRESDRLEVLTENLLATARAENTTADVERVDLGRVTSDVCASLDVVAERRAVTITRDVAEPVFVSANEADLRRAVFAVLDNAIKHSPAKGAVVAKLSADGQRAILRISDEGPGFSPEALGHGFERFWRGSAARGPEGTGLGLAIAQRIVNAFAGKITLSNHDGAVVEMSFICS